MFFQFSSLKNISDGCWRAGRDFARFQFLILAIIKHFPTISLIVPTILEESAGTMNNRTFRLHLSSSQFYLPQRMLVASQMWYDSKAVLLLGRIPHSQKIRKCAPIVGKFPVFRPT